MPVIGCKLCRKKFYAKPSWLKNGWGKYCSSKCQHKAQKKGKFVFCSICKKKIWRAPHEFEHSKSGKFFCNKSCQTLWRNKFYSGENHPLWKDGGGSYREFMIRNKIKQVCNRCGMDDIRVLLTHHIDCNRKNNKIGNLVWLCRNCHYLIHNRKTI